MWDDGMMDEDDPRVKRLQELACGLQTLANKLGAKLPEAYKEQCCLVTGRAHALCTNASYTSQADFIERAAVFAEEINKATVELTGVEEAEQHKAVIGCVHSSLANGYSVRQEPVANTTASATDETSICVHADSRGIRLALSDVHKRQETTTI